MRNDCAVKIKSLAKSEYYPLDFHLTWGTIGYDINKNGKLQIKINNKLILTVL